MMHYPVRHLSSTLYPTLLKLRTAVQLNLKIDLVKYLKIEAAIIYLDPTGDSFEYEDRFYEAIYNPHLVP
jgi:hypothetical protein